jgi:hypothetical protein
MGPGEPSSTRSAADRSGIRELLAEVYDHGLLHHAYTPSMRDYELVITASSDPRLGRPVEHYSYLVVTCVAATVESVLPPALWARSLDEELLHPDPERVYDAFVWGVEWQPLYPTFDLVDQSDQAAAWSAALGREFHELELESNAHRIRLVFSELRVRQVDVGYTPFVV